MRADDPGRDWANPAVNLRAIGLVFAGGAVGTCARYGITLLVPGMTFPAAILAVNLVGAFTLGWLGEALVLRVRTVSARSSLRLLLGTGVLGGFTTYSAFAGDTARFLRDGNLRLGFAYALISIVVGAIAGMAGIRAGGRLRRPDSTLEQGS
ncbi:CrcB family protein [Rarobacter faecitabidus]|uniref:Fluoride-specific ion channel FluC n=1 Tax=Rarobacter faecitabidus TaxID=13243 RepID=A0A542ZUH3_RARFA|nr:CrcB family protein [Rarobacter faecitabidus]TQL64013.1 CrcB protein [Rarobacter faecitabidus]